MCLSIEFKNEHNNFCVLKHHIDLSKVINIQTYSTVRVRQRASKSRWPARFVGINNDFCSPAVCQPGRYSQTGYTPCEMCPLHHYQNLEGQTSCKECNYNQRTYKTGSINSSECIIAGLNKRILVYQHHFTTTTTTITTTTTTTTTATSTTITTTNNIEVHFSNKGTLSYLPIIERAQWSSWCTVIDWTETKAN